MKHERFKQQHCNFLLVSKSRKSERSAKKSEKVIFADTSEQV